ncbi:DUF2946 domain-containing protein [Phreatobacter aquaticus]|uniref:DUF2946 domain-containing protein n=1 Tax=Phreatobacter aquaticus TaxID=2570229 RepID=A0A4D7QIG5_9HYPH|nr:DUF2946 family protein [Phreatobacter aquaticus]QCK86461.1 DUF2946 domain-containing protein [Phreatobacter aquaticus]
MNLFRSARYRHVRTLVVAAMAYVIAATGLLGAVSHSSAVAAPGGLLVLCTMEGMTTVRDDGSVPAHKPLAADHCLLCSGISVAPAAAEVTASVTVEPVATATIFVRTYDAILPPYAFTGWLGTRSPRAPPFTA